MLPSSLSSALLSALLLAGPLQAARQCYWIDGTPSDDSQQPCNPNDEHSACCAINKNNPDICLSSGLCYAQDSGFEGMIYSNGCTDKTGMAAACPHICPDRTNSWKGGPVINSYNVLQCNAGSKFCCRKATDSENCCGNESAAISVNVGQLRLSTKTTTTTVGAGATATVTPASCEAASSNKSQTGQCPKDNSAVVGGAVGGVLGVALLASLGALAVVCLRKPKEYHTYHGPTEYSNNITVSGPPPQELPTRPVHEMQGSQVGSSYDYSPTTKKPR
ncbi:hypothetical protein CDD83_7501 [Cordyceps sp. RAO-2017]|nr:hypothetical protein CDD83_7501 [Cordyceps sp. RAO-2017]